MLVARARGFIEQVARPLEKARFAYHFEDGSAQAVIGALAAFQNPDGGLGHGLEPDFRLSESSALCTTVGLQVLREVDAPAEDPLVKNVVGYLVKSYNEKIRAWAIIPANDNSAPHGPWWDYDDAIADRWGGFLANPRAEIIGHLYHYQGLVDRPWLDGLGEAALTFLRDKDTLEMHELLCYVRLAETESVPHALRSELISRLIPIVGKVVTHDSSAWNGYCLQPIQVASTPRSVFYRALSGALDENLALLAACQGEDGAWPTRWSWADQYPEAWNSAEREWKGVLTLDALRTLQAFGRLGAY